MAAATSALAGRRSYPSPAASSFSLAPPRGASAATQPPTVLMSDQPPSYPSRLAECHANLDASGIGHNVEARLHTAGIECIGFLALAARRVLHQLHHDQLSNVPTGLAPTQTPAAVEQNAHRIIQAALPGICGEFVQWNVLEARQLCAAILENVNDHANAAVLYQLATEPHFESTLKL